MERYLSYSRAMEAQYGQKVYKIALDGGFTCPNRDGRCGTRGCIFCLGGSGDFAVPAGENFGAAVAEAYRRVADKAKGRPLIAYFQSYTNTYAPVSYLRSLFGQAVAHPQIAGLNIGTRPDCLEQEKIDLLQELNRRKPVTVELGLQTVHESTASYLRRGYDLHVFGDAVSRLQKAGIPTVVHLILFLPGESEEMMMESADYVAHSGVQGVKLQLLHVLRGTDLAADYEAGRFTLPHRDTYLRVVGECVQRMPPSMVIHRLTGDGNKLALLAPLWSADKKGVLNALHAYFEQADIRQGKHFVPASVLDKPPRS